MALDKIRKANKKAKRQQKRRVVKAHVTKQRTATKIKQKRARKMIAEGRREFHAKRRADKNYLSALETEILNG